ncbi:CRISPR-associated endonuclease Cas1 [Methanolobus sp. ZRKC2]|uniref:CRISPR-associated endonuclease Cas1 n=1 Tax=Methanolobus sp. ZRKC2 TaxID=3125783 RepID=UPI003873C6CB
MNPSKISLAYDLQEPFRFLVDLAVISLIKSKKMDNIDEQALDVKRAQVLFLILLSEQTLRQEQGY